MQSHTKNNINLFRYLFILTGFFVVIELCVFLQSSELYLGDYEMIADKLKIPAKVFLGIFQFLSAQLFIHLLYVSAVYCIVRLMGVASKKINNHIHQWGLWIWVLGLIIILLANQIQFPNSKFAILTKSIIHYPILAKILLSISLGLLSIALMIAVIGLWRVSIRYKKTAILAMLIPCLIVIFLIHSHRGIAVKDGASQEKPNIIFIGLDALRPDFLGFFGAGQTTPNIDAFLERSTVFSEALTPLARTYPSWVSILTGAYPKQSNVRYNLSDQMAFDLKQTLPAILRDHGYQTMYAMDETRFSNINQAFGFDQLITPPMGFNDFLVGTINDFPMSNLLINTWVGKHLFPFSYGNRPVYTTYDPNSFLKLLDHALQQPRDKPLFLATHFCLTHYPYVWADVKYNTKNNGAPLYQMAVNKADAEFSKFLEILKKNKLLEHSIVVVLSDHGESFLLDGDRVTEKELYIPGKDNKNREIPAFHPSANNGEKVNQSVGHGTDVLGLTQSHTVLSFRFFGVDGQKPNLVSGWASLIDIKPTILDLLKIESAKQNGKSLIDYISAKKTTIEELSHFYMESDFTPDAVYSVHPETRKVLFQGINFFQINPKTTLITIKKSMGDLIVSSKQFADFYGPWVLALYPQHQKPMIPILVNLDSGLWTDDLRTPFAKNSPAKEMLSHLKTFFGDDIKGKISTDARIE